MSKLITLEAQPRTVIGKQVRQLRAQDLIPGVVYGPHLDNAISVQIPWRDLRVALREAGGTNLIELSVGSEKYSVLAREVQRDVISGDPLHIDFYAVSLDTRLRVEVPVVFVGKAALVESGEAMLITRANSVEVECLPNAIPEELTLDISRLSEIGDYLTVADLSVPPDVTVLSDPEEILVRTDYATALPTEEEEEALEFEAGAEEVEVIRRRREEEEEGGEI